MEREETNEELYVTQYDLFHASMIAIALTQTTTVFEAREFIAKYLSGFRLGIINQEKEKNNGKVS